MHISKTLLPNSWPSLTLSLLQIANHRSSASAPPRPKSPAESSTVLPSTPTARSDWSLASPSRLPSKLWPTTTSSTCLLPIRRYRWLFRRVWSQHSQEWLEKLRLKSYDEGYVLKRNSHARVLNFHSRLGCEVDLSCNLQGSVSHGILHFFFFIKTVQFLCF